MKILYKPVFLYIFVELLILLFSYYVVLDWLPLTSAQPFVKYSWPSLFYMVTWVVVSYLLGRYKPLKVQSYFQSFFKLILTSVLVFFFYRSLIITSYNEFSIKVLFLITVAALIFIRTVISIYLAYLYATEYHDIPRAIVKERKDASLKISPKLDSESYHELCSVITDHSGSKTLHFLKKNIDLESGNTFLVATTDSVIFRYIPFYQYSTIVQLEKLNNIQGINKMLTIANEKLSDDGLLICCYETKSTYKKRFLKQYPKGINYLFYCFDYLHNRIYPKLVLTKRLHALITGGKNRVFSKAEILGRFYYCGFEVISEKKVGNLTYIFSKRVKHPQSSDIRPYGPLITLRRLGKNKKPLEVYKIRSMHPFSEYIQAYIFEKNNLKDGGKFHKDIRITTVGAIFRRYWLDELPMLYNLLKGEMKLVGVRPLSPHYFSLYTPELQERRTHYKPGLLPPFYADMPRTLEEIEASELRYLDLCEKEGVLKTDIRYFFKIMKNIVFKKQRSS